MRFVNSSFSIKHISCLVDGLRLSARPSPRVSYQKRGKKEGAMIKDTGELRLDLYHRRGIDNLRATFPDRFKEQRIELKETAQCSPSLALNAPLR